LKLRFNKCALKQNFTMKKRTVIIIGKLQLGLRSVKPKKQLRPRSVSGRLQLGLKRLWSSMKYDDAFSWVVKESW
jgi:hypothetical protein